MKLDQNAESAFTESKQILANATLLVHPDPMAQINITCDASDVAVGGVLQYLNGMWQPLSFFSKKLNPAETRYRAFDHELLAVYATIKHFRHNLEGRNFFVNTVHKPLTFVMSSVTERASLRQTLHLALIAEFTTDIRYVKGETNFVADALSRPSVSAIDDGPVINYKELSIDQAKERFDHVHIDIVGPLPYANGFRYLLTCVDRFTRWPEAIPIVDIRAETVADAFFSRWIARYGTPATITTDRGARFESKLWDNLCNKFGIIRNRTTSYHPQSNGMVERFHRQLKAAIMAHEFVPQLRSD